ncbi:translation initiation factor IF-2 [Desulfofustis glycolicus]|uniref:Translation initiation factor IF-2 n=1 Tax=Desulfofustis glycolicus DSM 9705 TaxID=1121409 RepID=A0A1M5T1E7_9BACT|nr:translation initiation factor IF-2 [Desulfofustis glycolicus]MCB2215310.1 translation initiation factor IF-2 [Desulfobulbaceae bacterium]SHH44589.1 bacterial translation initiation factor 2 (bIF-2) [Desulfofustis glycolicus DSM 9705]
MSRVRVYELAKEAGMTGKDLADKLIAEGYDVKGHSSTVDEDTAEKIRRTMLQNSETELVEKRIDASQGATVIRRRATIIRRRPKAEQEEAAEETTEIEQAEQDGTGDSDADRTAVQAEAEEASILRQSGAEEEQQSPAGETAEPAEEVAQPAADADRDETPSTETDDGALAETVEDSVAQPGEPDDREAAAPPAKSKKVERKTIARVVGSIDLPVPDESDTAERSRPKKMARSTASKTGRPKIAVEFQPETPAEASERARKKGKRAVGTADDDDRDRRGKGARKGGKKSVKFTHFDADYQRGGKRGKRGRKADKRIAPSTIEMKASKRKITVFDTITVGDLAARMKVKASEVIAKLMGLGVMATMNQVVDIETATLIATDFGYEVEQGITEEIGIQLLDAQEEGGETKMRPPVVTVMGHVDHGKTSILDAIRKTDVAEGEAGGITQHIGAYHVRSKAGDVTFVDTPGHAAFTEMRSRGAQITDLVILVVAADDGVMDQTKEAINHAQAAGVPILVAVNKIDKDNADPDRVKRELSDFGLIPEDWGGQTIYCETSAKKNVGIDELLENIQLMAEMLELQADASRKAKGRVVEAQLDKGRGAVATVLIQDGTLRNGDYFVVGQYSGKVRAMRDDKGRPIREAGPSAPIEVQGLSGVPLAGDEFIVVTDEKMAKNVSQARSMKVRETELAAGSKISLDKLFEKMSEGDVQELRVIIRADVQGTLEAFAKAAEELSTETIKVRVLHEGTGTITESDILLASASDAIIIGFNVRPTAKIKDLASRENVDLRSYDVIYHALDDIRKAMLGMLDPTFEEEVIGTAEIRDTFSVPKVGKIAGCFVTDGAIRRNAGVRVVRDGVVVYTGKISSLRRFKDDAKEVVAGYECGIGVEHFNDIKVGDQLEAFVMQQVEAKLD